MQFVHCCIQCIHVNKSVLDYIGFEMCNAEFITFLHHILGQLLKGTTVVW